MKKRVLIIDDDPVVQETTAWKLREAGYEVVIAKEPSEALAIINDCTPDIVLLEVVFAPSVGNTTWDGLAFISWVRGLQALAHARFIIITSQDPEIIRANKLARLAMAIFQKPIDHKALLAKITSISSGLGIIR